jgi:hypothetical protein
MWKSPRLVDVSLALGLLAAVWLASLLFGDRIYAGFLYYAAVWAGLVVLVQLVRAPPLFTTGAAVALAISVLAYWAWQSALPEPQGLLGLGHLISVPGLGLAALAAGVFARRRQLSRPAAFAIALVSCVAGFALAQIALCQSVMYCGRLSVFTG